ncbi:hypothetical protein HRbin17_00396 [bacterium HR17]|uniref:Uncharacterized protein n=1 Tax=Candidatus Fervidibacter japonicus TaxID=2035412 RepID=A0A2H5X9N1_9BACT|nr:hypothetical protein HRbin17_00396 [bacterium HR17]
MVIVQHGVESKVVAVALRVTDEVNGVVQGGVRRELSAQALQSCIAQLRQFQPVTDTGIRRHDARTARIGDDSGTPPFGEGLVRESDGVLKQVFHRVHTQDARLREDGIVNFVAARQ